MAATRAEQKLSRVLITGGTDGLGRAAAVLLAEHGYRVFAGARSLGRRAALDQFALERKLPLETLELDVCDDASVDRAVGEIERRGGPVDILVNSAGIAIAAVMEEITLSDLRKQFETNFFGVVRVTQAVLPYMRERRRGRILMMSSVSGLLTPPAQGAYSSSKHALEGLSNALRLEMYAFGVAVVLIEPGYIVTGIQQVVQELSKPYADRFETGPYAALYAGFMASVQKARAKSKTTPEQCARVILQAIEAPRPKARYGVTPTATFAKWSKRLLSDRAIDAMLRRRFGIARGP